MLFLPAAALCCLCSALVAMAAELVQDQLSLTRRVGEPVSFSCERTEQCEAETFVTSLKDEQVVKPVVSVYPAASRAHLEGRSSLLCLASAMFPPLVQFSWKRQKEGGPLEELPPAEGEQLELTEPGRSAAILLVDRGAFYTYKYHCYVKHEGGTVKAQTAQVVPLDPLRPQCRVKLLCLLYTVLIVKSLLYCCGLPLLMSLRNKGLWTVSVGLWAQLNSVWVEGSVEQGCHQQTNYRWGVHEQQNRESTAVEQTLHYQHCVEQTEQLHPALRPERIQGNHCNREGVKEKPIEFRASNQNGPVKAL
ncbi:hypothetical protein INR49_016378 [Caranx melampygus]|nr:hypothetical protein INR49_016378 [Caranx melampygus]